MAIAGQRIRLAVKLTVETGGRIKPFPFTIRTKSVFDGKNLLDKLCLCAVSPTDTVTFRYDYRLSDADTLQLMAAVFDRPAFISHAVSAGKLPICFSAGDRRHQWRTQHRRVAGALGRPTAAHLRNPPHGRGDQTLRMWSAGLPHVHAHASRRRRTGRS